MEIILTLLIIAIVVFIAFYIIDAASPDPKINQLMKLVVGAIALFWLLKTVFAVL